MAGGRDAWVNYAKAIGILLVVYRHVARGVYNAGNPMDAVLYERVDSITYSFHRPLLFFLSGLFFLHSLNRRGLAGLTANKIDTIVYPYLKDRIPSALHVGVRRGAPAAIFTFARNQGLLRGRTPRQGQHIIARFKVTT